MIRINEDYIIDCDEVQYILKQDLHKTETKNGKESPVVKSLGFYSTLENALRGYIGILTRKRHATVEMSVYDALRVIGEEREALERLLKRYARG